MSHINITEYDETDETTKLVGWFNPSTAIMFKQDTEWDGNNMIGVITRSQWIDEYLYRTAGGRWVLNHDEHRSGSGVDTYRFVDDETARDWLIRSQVNDEAVEKYFGAQPDERGPGRPAIGDPINVRFPDDLLSRVDHVAQVEGFSRAEAVRMLVARGLAGLVAA